MAVQLPNELIFEILSRLPSKSLLRCRSVCKSWLSLISSTQFVLNHLHNFNKLNPRNFVHRFDRRQGEVTSVHLDDQLFTLDPTATIEFPLNIDRDHIAYFRIGWKFNIIGCCNGVVCLYNRKTKEDEVILWNPSIRRKVTTSAPPMNNNRYWLTRFLVFGFGYDTISDDYKVVTLAYDGVSFSFRPQVKVYAVKTGIWSTVGFPHDLPCFYIFPNWSQMVFNGSVHWIASEPKRGLCSHKSIMTFDISTEVFGEIQLPNDLAIGEFEATMVLSIVRDSLAVIYFEREAFAFSTYKIWALKEYKKPASWTLLYDMDYPDKDLGQPLRMRNNGDMIMDSDNRDLVIYNHNANVCYYGYSSGFDGDVDHKTYVDKYQEGLVLLDVGHSVPNDNE